MKESAFQKNFLDRVREVFPEAVILKNDPTYFQGIPDWIILYKNRWAMLEMKKSKTAHFQPNQKRYISMLDDMSFSRAVYPENEDEVFYELCEEFSKDD